MKRRGTFVVILLWAGVMLLCSVAAAAEGEGASLYALYDRDNWNLRYYMRGDAVYDTDWVLRYRIYQGAMYDLDWERQYFIKEDGIYDKDLHLRYLMKQYQPEKTLSPSPEEPRP